MQPSFFAFAGAKPFTVAAWPWLPRPARRPRPLARLAAGLARLQRRAEGNARATERSGLLNRPAVARRLLG